MFGYSSRATEHKQLTKNLFTIYNVLYISQKFLTHISLSNIHRSVLVLCAWTAIVKRASLWYTYVLVHFYSSTFKSLSQPELHSKPINNNGTTQRNAANKYLPSSTIPSTEPIDATHTMSSIDRTECLKIFFIIPIFNLVMFLFQPQRYE